MAPERSRPRPALGSRRSTRAPGSARFAAIVVALGGPWPIGAATIDALRREHDRRRRPVGALGVPAPRSRRSLGARLVTADALRSPSAESRDAPGRLARSVRGPDRRATAEFLDLAEGHATGGRPPRPCRARGPRTRGRARRALAAASDPRTRGPRRDRGDDPTPGQPAPSRTARAPRSGHRRPRRAGHPGHLRPVTAGPIAIGSRGSALALAQARLVARGARARRPASRIVIVETEGDRRAPDTAWGEGAFVAAIERALLDGAVDVAVHSAKDVPTDQDPRLRIAAYLPRADPRDALVVRTRRDGASARRSPARHVGSAPTARDGPGFLLAHRPDLVVHPLHGNVDTRLRRLDEGETDALVLACAGLDRLGLGDRIAERLSPEIVPPAPGQGAIAVQIRRDDARMLALVAAIDDSTHPRWPSRPSARSSRHRGGGCRAPIGALATIDGDELDLLGGYASPDGSRHRVRAPPRSGRGWRGSRPTSSRSSSTRELAFRATRSTPAGAATLERSPRPRHASRRPGGELLSALRDAGLDPVSVPAIAVEFERTARRPRRRRDSCHTYRWVVITSANGARAILKAAERILTELGAPSLGGHRTGDQRRPRARGHRGRRSSRVAAAGSRWPRSSRSTPATGSSSSAAISPDEELADALRARGADVDDVIAYRTLEAPEAPARSFASAMEDGPIAAVVFTSGSTVRGLLSLAATDRSTCLDFPAICIGPETAGDARAAGFRSSPSPRPGRHLPRRRHRRRPDPASHRRSRDARPRSPAVAGPSLGAGRRAVARPRRLRRTPALRALVRETRLASVDAGRAAVRPPGHGRPRAGRLDARAWPGCRRTSPLEEAARLAEPRRRRRAPVRPARGQGRARARRRRPTTGSSRRRCGGSARSTLPLVTIADTCLCEYTDHGHCGPLAADGSVDNDAALARLAETAVAPGPRGRRHRGAERDDGRPGRAPSAPRSMPRASRQTAIMAYAVEARLGVLRPVPRGRRQRARVRRPARLPDGPGQRPRGDARDGARRRRGRGHPAGQAGAARRSTSSPRRARGSTCRSPPTRCPASTR